VPQIDRSVAMTKDSVNSLLKYESAENWQSSQAFLSQCLRYLEKGYHVYTYVQNDILAHYGWLIEQQEQSFFTEVDQTFEFPKGSAVLFDFYTHPKLRGKGLYQLSLRQMLHDAAHIPGTQQIFIAVLSKNSPSRHVIEKIGFDYVCSLYRTGEARARTGEISLAGR
jgi:RimJ/RimL family protein N-acetyltransferase